MPLTLIQCLGLVADGLSATASTKSPLASYNPTHYEICIRDVGHAAYLIVCGQCEALYRDANVVKSLVASVYREICMVYRVVSSHLRFCRGGRSDTATDGLDGRPRLTQVQVSRF